MRSTCLEHGPAWLTSPVMKYVIVVALSLLAACGRGIPETARIVVAGDSVMAWNRSAGASVADGLQARLGEPVGDVSLSLAQVAGGWSAWNIPTQLEGLRAEWVVLNGGANDLSTGCTCSSCGPVLDRLISDDGKQGAIPDLVANLRARGSQVIWADYYTAPRYAGTACEAPYQVLEERLGRIAHADAGVTLVDLDDVFLPDDLSLFATDRLHPSQKGSARIAGQIAPLLAR
ncbi:SGNH/GDSL hydrolase family protein [Roseovarius mucosus]|uniref:SGNH/GDSL hydrolase family protein n=1 Tax=Roseovarius mucosus TaxID=215743 RepID=UPI0021509228|nr:SGNH/GDSL hydrolase family protein [Roseovarius mucosus]